ncbi:hypothetical protein P9302_06285 [Brevibacillus agri]|uniref:hypothetical protein n=1 Tax=Brevibacillus agri TaxID=51101 RepID=UPI002E210C2B|nr:hypothetical protein [Brevibacillus agri]
MASEQKIKLGDEEYILFYEDGKPILKQYDAKYKMWVELMFLGTGNSKEIEDFITQILSDEYIKRMSKSP